MDVPRLLSIIRPMENDMKEKQNDYDELLNKPESRLWIEDLREFFHKYRKTYNQSTNKKQKTVKANKITKKKTKKNK